MYFARFLFVMGYSVLTIAVVSALFTGLRLDAFSQLFWRLGTFAYIGIDQEVGFLRDIIARCSYVAEGLSTAVKDGLFSWWWSFFRWLFGNITACALGLVVVHVFTLLPDMAFKRFKFGSTVLVVPFLSGALYSVFSESEFVMQNENIMLISILALAVGNIVHFVCRNSGNNGLAVTGAVLLLIPSSAVAILLGAIFSLLLLAAIAPMFLILIFSAGGSGSGTGGGSSSSRSSGGSTSGYSSYSSGYSDYSSGYSDYSSGTSDSGYSSYSSYSSGGDGGGGSNLGGYSSPDVGGGYYNSSYGYSSPDVGGSGYYNMNYGYTGKDVGGGYYNMTYGYSSPDVGGGYYNMTYGYSSDDSYGGSYNG